MIILSEILNGSIKLFQKNNSFSLEELGKQFDNLERKARGCYFVGQVIGESKEKNNKIAPLFEEIFIDLFQSITSCLNGQYRLAYQSLRSSLELTVAAVYFFDHLVEFDQWMNDNWDFHFSLHKEILSKTYSSALGVKNPPKEQHIANQYRFLSQFVHGKYGFMTSAQDGPILQYDKARSLEFITTYNTVFSCIIKLINYRFNDLIPRVIEKYPYFRGFIQTEMGVDISGDNI